MLCLPLSGEARAKFCGKIKLVVESGLFRRSYSDFNLEKKKRTSTLSLIGCCEPMRVLRSRILLLLPKILYCFRLYIHTVKVLKTNPPNKKNTDMSERRNKMVLISCSTSWFFSLFIKSLFFPFSLI